MATPASKQTLRQLPLVAGTLGGILLLVNRLLTPDLTSSQARSDVLGVVLSAVLILVGLLWQQIQPRSPDAVTLMGEEGLEFAPHLPEPTQRELAWASHILLTNTATRTVLVWYDGQVLLRRGVLAPKATVEPGPLLQQAMSRQKPIYLVDLKLYPGRVEFDYLPANTQGLICQPLGKQGVLILGANAPRSYTAQDEIWVEAIAAKLGDTLSQHPIQPEQFK